MEKLNNELLKEPEVEEKEKTHKRNSKDELIHKIVELSRNNDIKLEHSDYETSAHDKTAAERAVSLDSGEDYARRDVQTGECEAGSFG